MSGDAEYICVKCYYRWWAYEPDPLTLRGATCPNCNEGVIILTGDKS